MPPEGGIFLLENFFATEKEIMGRDGEQVVEGTSGTHCAKIVVLLRAPAKPILCSCSAAKLHLSQICLALFISCPAPVH